MMKVLVFFGGYCFLSYIFKKNFLTDFVISTFLSCLPFPVPNLIASPLAAHLQSLSSLSASSMWGSRGLVFLPYLIPLCQRSGPGGIFYKGRDDPLWPYLPGNQVRCPYSPSGPPLLIPQSHAQLWSRPHAGTCPDSVSTPVDSCKFHGRPSFPPPVEPSQSPILAHLHSLCQCPIPRNISNLAGIRKHSLQVTHSHHTFIRSRE